MEAGPEWTESVGAGPVGAEAVGAGAVEVGGDGRRQVGEPVIIDVDPGDEPAVAAATALFDAYRVHHGASVVPGAAGRWLADQLGRNRLAAGLATDRAGAVQDGFGLVTWVTLPASLDLREFVQVRDLWVCPTDRRRGVGRALLAHVVDRAVAARASRVSLQTDAANAAALALYSATGFTAVSGLEILSRDL